MENSTMLASTTDDEAKAARVRVPLEPRALASVYLTMKERLVAAGFGDEIDWQEELASQDLTEEAFLREAAWVVLSCGFRESVVRGVFPFVSRAFRQWVSAEVIVLNSATCLRDALEAFPNAKKINAILSIATQIADSGFITVRRHITERGVAFLNEFPFMGAVTALHLAKNIGLAVVKPDRHLVRAAEAAGYPSPHELCTRIASIVGDVLPVVDLVIWRYAATYPREGELLLRDRQS